MLKFSCSKIRKSSDGRVVRASASGAVDSIQINDFKIGICSFPALRSALKGKCGEQAVKFTRCAVEKGTYRDSPFWCGRQAAGNS